MGLENCFWLTMVFDNVSRFEIACIEQFSVRQNNGFKIFNTPKYAIVSLFISLPCSIFLDGKETLKKSPKLQC